MMKCLWGIPGGASDKEHTCQYQDIRDTSVIPGSGRSEGGHGNPLQCSCLENLIGRGAWQATVHGVAKSWTQLEQLRTHISLYAEMFIGQ